MNKYSYKHSHTRVNTEAWMVTFSDLLLLLLTCFALKLATVLPTTPNTTNSALYENSRPNINTTQNTQASNFVMLDGDLQHIAQRIAHTSIQHINREQEVEHIISLHDGCFAIGSSTPTFRTNELISTISNLVINFGWSVSVSTFVSEPDKSSIPTSRWSLAQARTNTLLQALMEKGVKAEKLSGIGYGIDATNLSKTDTCVEITLKQKA